MCPQNVTSEGYKQTNKFLLAPLAASFYTSILRMVAPSMIALVSCFYV